MHKETGSWVRLLAYLGGFPDSSRMLSISLYHRQNARCDDPMSFAEVMVNL